MRFLKFLFLTIVCTSYAQSIEKSVIGSFGGTQITGATTLNFTGGEVVVGVQTEGNSILSNGFHSGFTLSGIYWNGNVNTLWNEANNWDGAILPNKTDNVIIVDKVNDPVFNVAVDSIRSLELRTNALLKISAGNSLVLLENGENAGELIVESEAAQSGVLLVKGNFIGNATYKRGGLLANKWSSVSAPVTNQSIKDFAENINNEIRTNTSVTPANYAIARYNDANAVKKWEYYNTTVSAGENFILAKGYSMSRSTDGDLTFTGGLYTTNVASTVVENQWNLIGNPYTTYYPANKNGGSSFLDDSLADLDDLKQAVYLWDNSQLKYVATTNLVTSSQRFFTPGQGFFVKVKTGVNVLNFLENKRDVLPAEGKFFNKEATTTPFIQLFVESNGVKVNTDILYYANATLGFDVGYDIENFDSSGIDVFSHLIQNNQDKNYTIQSLPQGQFETMIVPIGLKASVNEQITFNSSQESLPADVKVYLEDRKENVFTLLDSENKSYQVTMSEDVNGTGRFYVHTSSTALDLEGLTSSKIKMYASNNKLYIKNIDSENTHIQLFDVLGKKVFEENTFITNDKKINLSHLSAGVYVVNLSTNKEKISKKIVLK
ncbi:T9SS type A sorting domain-containing protein [Polaribacter sp.]|uniref:T9SS type A sorting domain-containing protein n=1 Tax=Polaribacter sp. TaxID=1920175 RepID=UPI003EFA0B1B